ncbi:MAG: hypothetical protein KatS3mg026_0110 [Bacteroidia bacterium]|nr:MAG: hypothetical protein KatS3mg026_0110 [Bacteroidia bacterium]
MRHASGCSFGGRGLHHGTAYNLPADLRGGGADEGYSIIHTSDGGYAIVGTTGSFGTGEEDTDVYVLKLDQAGEVQWERVFGGSKWDVGSSIIQTSDGGYAIVGSYGFVWVWRDGRVQDRCVCA